MDGSQAAMHVRGQPCDARPSPWQEPITCLNNNLPQPGRIYDFQSGGYLRPNRRPDPSRSPYQPPQRPWPRATPVAQATHCRSTSDATPGAHLGPVTTLLYVPSSPTQMKLAHAALFPIR